MKWTRDNWITIPGYAISELHLSGNELLAYGLIAGFSHDGESQFSGTLEFIGDALNVTKRGAIKIIDRLIERGLVDKTTSRDPQGHCVNYYRVTYYDNIPGEQSSLGQVNKMHIPGEQSSLGQVNNVHPAPLEYKNKTKDRLNIGVTPAEQDKPAKPVKFDYKQWLLEHDVPEATANDWLQVRKAKKASNTLSAAAALEREAGKAGITIAEAVQLCAENSWQGFRAEYLRNRQQAAAPRRFLAPGMVDTLEYTEKAEKELMRLRAEREAREKAEQQNKDNYEHKEDRGVLFQGY